jgi:hypothetical protein
LEQNFVDRGGGTARAAESLAGARGKFFLGALFQKYFRTSTM